MLVLTQRIPNSCSNRQSHSDRRSHRADRKVCLDHTVEEIGKSQEVDNFRLQSEKDLEGMVELEAWSELVSAPT